MLQYETVFVTDPALPEEELEDLIKAFDQITTTAGGKIVKVERWGKRRLSYPICHQEEGVYVLMIVECPPDLVKEFDRRYRLNDRILRHLTVRVESESQLGPSPMMKPRPGEREEAAPQPTPAAP